MSSISLASSSAKRTICYAILQLEAIKEKKKKRKGWDELRKKRFGSRRANLISWWGKGKKRKKEASFSSIMADWQFWQCPPIEQFIHWSLLQRWERWDRQAIRENGPLSQSVKFAHKKRLNFTTENPASFCVRSLLISSSESFEYLTIVQVSSAAAPLAAGALLQECSSMGRQRTHRSSASIRFSEAHASCSWNKGKWNTTCLSRCVPQKPIYLVRVIAKVSLPRIYVF